MNADNSETILQVPINKQLDGQTELDIADGKIAVKVEPSGEDVIQRNEVYIKSEPAEYIDVHQQLSPAATFESVSVKIEPISYDNGDESQDSSEPRLQIDETAKDCDEADPDYNPPKKYKKKKNTKKPSNVKPVFRSSRNDYSEDILMNIEIVTITEEERKIEHRELLHSRQHMRYRCESCAIGFVVEEAYMMHMKQHSPECGSFECPICLSRLRTADLLYRHRLRHYRRYRCTLCRSLHKDKETAASHVMAEHAGQAFLCVHCGKGFKRPAYLKKHIAQMHTKPDRIECPICLRIFNERSLFRCHLRTHNEEVRTRPTQGQVVCDVCSRRFKNKAYLKRHLMVHDTAAACPRCARRCKNRDVLRLHLRRDHSDRKREPPPAAVCPHCQRTCTTHALLNLHIRRMHSGNRVKEFQCDHCKRFYYTKGEVRSHIAWSHMRGTGAGGAGGGGAAGHACACGRVFRTPALLREHAARDHLRLAPPRPHACARCGKAFTKKQLLTRHMKVHTDEKYPCTECGLSFKTQSYVKVHYKLKHLNMTRAELKALKKPKIKNVVNKKNLKIDEKELNKLAEKIVGSKRLSKEIVIIKSEPNMEDVAPPLNYYGSRDDVVIKEEREDTDLNIETPLFETFVDIQRT